MLRVWIWTCTSLSLTNQFEFASITYACSFTFNSCWIWIGTCPCSHNECNALVLICICLKFGTKLAHLLFTYTGFEFEHVLVTHSGLWIWSCPCTHLLKNCPFTHLFTFNLCRLWIWICSCCASLEICTWASQDACLVTFNLHLYSLIHLKLDSAPWTPGPTPYGFAALRQMCYLGQSNHVHSNVMTGTKPSLKIVLCGIWENFDIFYENSQMWAIHTPNRVCVHSSATVGTILVGWHQKNGPERLNGSEKQIMAWTR